MPPKLVILFVATVLYPVGAAEPKPEKKPDQAKTTFTDPGQAGPDFAAQGEYTGTIQTKEGSEKIGFQVIAMGNGQFRAVAYEGGLPGAGWDKSEKAIVDSTNQGGVVTFSNEDGAATIQGDKARITNPQGKEIGVLGKVIRKSPTLGLAPPPGAIVLFDGTSAEHFQGGRLTPDGLLMEGVTSKQAFEGDYTLHLEFLLPFMPYARGQGRANSGCYVDGRYEVQMLDSFGLEGKNNECGGLYSMRSPDVNMCLPPLSWQTYDIDFSAGRFDESGKKLRSPRLALRHNGVVIHDVELARPTPGGQAEGHKALPFSLQNHGNPVRYRNIWVLPKKDS